MIPEYNLLFQSDGSTLDTERFATDNTIQSYNEIGIAKDLNVIVIAPFKMTYCVLVLPLKMVSVF